MFFCYATAKEVFRFGLCNMTIQYTCIYRVMIYDDET